MSDDSSVRIAVELRRRVLAAAPGSRLPSSRELVAEFQAGPITVQKALRVLQQQGLVDARPGIGTFVRAVTAADPADFGWQSAALGAVPAQLPRLSTPLRSASPDAIALHAGYPAPDLLPERLVRGALARAARGSAAVSRSSTAGLPALQTWFAHEIADVTPAGIAAPAARDALIVPGSQSGLSSIFRSLVGRGQPLLIESPSYWGAILAAAQAGVRLVPVPSRGTGPDPHEVDRALEETGARAFYAQPNFANPTGAQWSPDVADSVLQIVRRRGAFLIEDDWAHDFGIDADARPLAALDDAGHVIYLRSLTKSVSPAIRIAAVVARGPARERILADRGAESMYVSDVLQAAAVDVVTQPGWRSHLRALRQQLRGRRDLLVESMREHVPEAVIDRVPTGGLHLWLRLPDGIDLGRLARDCETAGVLVAPGDEWFPAEPTGRFLRLNFAGAEPERYSHAAAVIGRTVRSQTR